MAHAKKKRHDDHGGDHPDERWLVTYADLMTLLVALFMVLFSISSVNKSKFETLQHSLQDAFSGRTNNIATPAPDAPTSTLQPYVGGRSKEATQAAGQTKEQQDFTKLKQEI